jgi:hypothetical protein
MVYNYLINIVNKIVIKITRNEYRLSDLKLSLSLIQNMIDPINKIGVNAKTGSHISSNIAPIIAN